MLQPQPLALTALGAVVLWMGVSGYWKGDFPSARMHTNRKQTPIWFWSVVVVLVGTGVGAIAISLLAAFSIAFDGRV